MNEIKSKLQRTISHQYLFFIAWLLFVILICDKSLSQSVNTRDVNQEDKEKVIANFKSEMKSLCDSSNYYFDLALDEIRNEISPNDISERVKSKIIFFESKMDATSKAFAKKATDAKLNQQEFAGVYKELSVFIQPVRTKFRELKNKGINLK